MSTTIRDASFIPKEKQNVPGPAFYFNKLPVDNFKDRLLKQHKLQVPFGSFQPCAWQTNPEQQKGHVPGPGAYIDINDPLYSSVTKSLYKLKQKTEWQGVIGNQTLAFGKTLTDEKEENLQRKTPGPGAYFTEESISTS
jgi:hypothetical protein